VAVADLATGQNAAIAILAALRHRDRTGRGQRIDVSLFDSQLAGLANVAASALFTGEDAPRYGNAHPSIVPYETFAAADAPFVLAVASEKLWVQACNALGRDDWLRDPRYANNAARVRHRDALRAELAALFATAPAAHWLALFEGVGVPAAPIHSVRAALDSEIAHARGMRIELGGVPLVGSPLNLSATPVEFCLPPPKLGEHTDEVAARFGFDAPALRAAGAVR
jgi:crotonobetainyl-CoA:carnitine CoA-transferase CaiB-like acyl-CoA transferase